MNATRRTFLAAAFVLPAVPLATQAQQPGKVYRVGILSPGGVPDPSVATAPNLVPRHLYEQGYVDGGNLVVQRRFADGKIDRLPALARELVRLPADVIVTAGAEATQAARDATATIPIVMVIGSDPVARGWVASLPRPGGNMTGITTVAEKVLAAKRLELIREAVPGAARIAVLSVGGPGSSVQVQEAQKAAEAMRVKLVVVEVPDLDYDRAFATMRAERVEALFVIMSPILTRDRKQIVDRAAKYRLPAIYEWREHAQVGGLMSYGGSIVDLSRRVAAYVDKILKGAKPGELPVEQPTKFELVINLKTAKALGLTIPPSLLLRADHVIEYRKPSYADMRTSFSACHATRCTERAGPDLRSVRGAAHSSRSTAQPSGSASSPACAATAANAAQFQAYDRALAVLVADGRSERQRPDQLLRAAVG